MSLVKNLTALLMSGVTVVSAMDGADGHDEKNPGRSNLRAAIEGMLSEYSQAYSRLAGKCQELSIKVKSLHDEHTSGFEKVKKMEAHLDTLESRLKELDVIRASLLTEQLKIFDSIAKVNESVKRFKERSLPLLMKTVSSGQLTGIDSSFFDLGRDPTDTDFQNLFAVLAPLKESVTDRVTKNVLNEYYTMAQSMFLVAAQDEQLKKKLGEAKAEHAQKYSLYKMIQERYESELSALEALRQKSIEAFALYQTAKGALDAFVIEQEEKYR